MYCLFFHQVAHPSFNCLLCFLSSPPPRNVSSDVVLVLCSFLFGLFFSSCQCLHRTKLLNKELICTHTPTHTKKTEPPTFHPIDRYKLVFVAIISPQNIEMFLFCVSYRSREEDRISKPGGMSTPVKIFDDGVLSQASDQASSINDKQLPPLPGKETACCQMAVF